MLKEKKINDESVNRVSQIASDESKPMDDIRGSVKYRKDVLKVVVRDAIKQAAATAKSVA